jgi:hypothetical protein
MALYLIWYGTGRMLIEIFLRIDPSAMFLGVRIHVFTAAALSSEAVSTPGAAAASDCRAAATARWLPLPFAARVEAGCSATEPRTAALRRESHA